jgi:hypothetical protein
MKAGSVGLVFYEHVQAQDGFAASFLHFLAYRLQMSTNPNGEEQTMTQKFSRKFLSASLLAAALAAAGSTTRTWAASHREAPMIALDPTADITDVYAFRSWTNPRQVVFIMNVIPSQEPSSGPNYFNFDDKVLYEIHLDTNQDGKAEDIVYQFRFKTEIRPPFNDLPVAYAGVTPAPAGLPPQVTALSGPGSAGLGLRQRYTVTEIKGNRKRSLSDATLFAVPSYVGPRTMGDVGDYEALAAKGIFSLKNGGKVFAGQRDETFYIDLGATFDTLNFRATPILSPIQDGDDTTNPFGVDMFSGFNVNAIAIQVPIAQITANPNAVIGMYASTSREQFGKFGFKQFKQVARMGNPLINELVIGTGKKDRWNAVDPKDEKQFVDFYLNPRLAAVLNLAFGTNFPTTNRTDLVNALLKYSGQPQTGACSKASTCSELLRLDLSKDPTQPANQKRLGILAGDAAGFPNGRRPNDDVTDTVLRVVAGALLGDTTRLGDGVNFNIGAQGSNLTANGIYTVFPYLPTPHDGRDRQHIDPGE